ncbi:MAG: hypothetical protein HY360_03160 [Verrucomicrobia bacterium]|nr:hypothetical protein [Verrucomicrobiota bacterium]
MTRKALFCGAVLIAIPILAPAKDFPLEFKTLNAQETMAFPGGAGLYGTLQAKKPDVITKEPAAVSKHPLYGQLSPNKFWFRIDESKGDGRGYDCLIADLNQNNDLTDDAAVMTAESPRQTSAANRQEVACFGPIPAPEEKKIGAWQPIYFAQMFLFARPADAASNARNPYLGQLQFKAGWYLETSVDFDGVTRKVGVVDGNCSFRLGELDQPMTYPNGSSTNWYFQGGDCFLQDNGGSGKFTRSVTDSGSAPFGPMLYLGAKPYQAVLATDCKSLAVEPWTEPLAELALQPHGEQVSVIQAAWESVPGKWQLLQAGVENGNARVPPGNHRLYTCALKVKTTAGDTLFLSGYQRSPKDTTEAKVGAATPFKCGAPLEIKVTSVRDKRGIARATQESNSLLDQIASNFGASEPPLQQRIEASVIGAGGELYSSFSLETKGQLRQPAKPTFTVLTADGKQVASGEMEFG